MPAFSQIAKTLKKKMLDFYFLCREINWVWRKNKALTVG